MKENSLEIIKEQARFYLSTPEKAAEALLFVRNLERFAKEVKEKVKERTVEIMDKNHQDMIEYQTLDEETGEIKVWQVKRDYGKQAKEYNVGNVIEALGVDAKQFLRVAKTDLDKFLKKGTAKGEITMQQMELAMKDATTKLIAGSGVIIKEVKPTVK